MTDDLEVAGNIVELLGDILAELAQPAAAVSAGTARGRMCPNHARQFWREHAWRPAPLARSRSVGRHQPGNLCSWKCGSDGCGRSTRERDGSRGIRFADINTYAYAGGRPSMSTDPAGLSRTASSTKSPGVGRGGLVGRSI
jgi:hypothetical protein